MKTKRIAKILKVMLIVVAASVVVGFLVQGLWNWLMPPIFGLRLISFWQALGLFFLGKLLFGGFRGRHGCGGPWRKRMKERWASMTPEERERFRQGMQARCGSFVPPPETSA
ncbi:MAG TPA: hypothetical protein VGR96_14950 [Acidobacteriaceae bacterium]|nr:hypothetical protein [Acidobacteriaceae bacterium]